MQHTGNINAYNDSPPPYSVAVGEVRYGQPPPATAPPPTIITVTPQTQYTNHIILTGNCPVCRTGFLRSRPSCFGILCCILLFPFLFLGLFFICCCRETYCPHCGAVV